MKRRDFLRTTTVVTLASTLGLLTRQRLGGQSAAAGSAPATPGPQTSFVKLRRNVGIFNGRGGTIGWLSSADALAVVDTQFPDTAAICLDGLVKGTDRTFDVVINTHHHGDHTSGNPVFKPRAGMIVAHANVPGLQRAAAGRANPPTTDKQVYADVTFPETWKMDLGGAQGRDDEVVHARHFGPAHTGGDSAILFEKANVVHMGDLVFNRIYPVIDRVGGASISNWIRVLETAVKTYPADAVYVYGHGNPKFGVTGQQGDLLVMRDYLTGLLDHTRKQIAAGKSRSEITSLENLPGFPDYHQSLPNRLSSNLGVAYDELTTG